MIILNFRFRENGGAGASYAITNDDFAASDPDWIVICPCGLNIEETKREMQSIWKADWWYITLRNPDAQIPNTGCS